METNEGKVCEECGKPYRPLILGEQNAFAQEFQKSVVPGVTTIWLPDCECKRKRWDAERLAEDRKESQERGLRRFAKLGMGPYTKYEDMAPYPKNTLWENPFEALKCHQKLIIRGPVGSHKTTLAKKIAANLLVNNHLVVRGYVPELLKKLKAFDHADEQDEAYQWLHMGEVLLLDDLDKLLGSRFEVEQLLMLVDFYNRNNRSIIVTMNTNFESFMVDLTSNKFQVNPDFVTSLVSRLTDGAAVVVTKLRDSRNKILEVEYDG